MSKYVINESTLTAIGDAVRGKSGTSDLIPVSGLADAITNLPSGGGGDLPEEAFLITGDCQYRFAYGGWDWFLKDYGNRITTNDLTNCSHMFRDSKLKEIPFKLNLKDKFSGGMNYLFYYATDLESIKHDITCTNTNYIDMGNIFSYCKNLKQVPYLYNAYPASMDGLFANCTNLREIPEDYFDTWNFSRLMSYGYASMAKVFQYCYSLRKLPRLYEYITSDVSTTTFYLIYDSGVANCYVLEEVVDLPVVANNLTSNAFGDTFANTFRLKRMTFKTNEDGTAKTINWKNQVINLTKSGYCGKHHSMPLDQWTESDIKSASSYIINYNSGITVDKAIYNDETYNLLKNDPDAYALANTEPNKIDLGYAFYNHDAAVETINSLPDTSAYGTNAIQFSGNAGGKTDGGAINTLTDTEIAVAASKGWTVTLV